MTTAAYQQENLSTRQRWISLSEFVLAGAIVIAHNVYHRVPNEVPILFVLGWISIRLRDGGWKMVGLHKPDSWRKTILWGVLVGVLIIVAGQLADFVGAKIWHQAAKGPAVIKEAKATWKTALLGLSLVWTFAAFGEKMGYRGYLMTRAADVGKSRRRPTWRHCLCPVCCSAMGTTLLQRSARDSTVYRFEVDPGRCLSALEG